MSNSPTNLPLQLTSFVGRERALTEVKQLLCAEPVRLVTLTGAGGCGKTRLALQVAADLLDAPMFSDGVWLIELAPLASPELVPQAFAAAFDLRETPNCSLTQALLNYLLAKKILVLLDNCEHVIEASARLAEALLRGCPTLRVLATSREALGILGERSWRVPSLTMPDLNRLNQPGTDTVSLLTQAETARLFVDRALAVAPNFRLTERNVAAVAQICQRLDGMPLALELAAARVKTLSVEDIATHLDDCFHLLTTGSRTALPRQQTLQAAIDWSYALLTEDERVLFRRLAVFAGGWTLDAAEQVGSGEWVVDSELTTDRRPRSTVFDTLSRLVDKSLVAVEEYEGATRYRMLETIRQYARDKLIESGELDQMRDHHLDYFVQLAECAGPKLQSSEQIIWLHRLDAERDNLRAAWRWSLENQRDALHSAQVSLRLAVALWYFWVLRGNFSEGREWLEHVLTLPEHPTLLPLRARALVWAGQLAWYHGDYPRAYALAEIALPVCQQVEDPEAMGFCLELLSAQAQGKDWKRSEQLIQESLAVFSQMGPAGKWGYADALSFLGWTIFYLKDRPRANEIMQRNLALCTELGDHFGMAHLLEDLGVVARMSGEYARAEKYFADAVNVAGEFGIPGVLARGLQNLGVVALHQGNYDHAKSRLTEAVTIYRETSQKSQLAFALTYLGIVFTKQGNYAHALTMLNESLTLRQALGQSVVWTQFTLGDVYRRQGDLEKTRALYAEALTWERDKRKDMENIAEVIRRIATLDLGEPGSRQKAQRAVKLFSAATNIRQANEVSQPPVDRADDEQMMAMLRLQLGDAKFDAAYAQGKPMTWEQATDYALAELATMQQVTPLPVPSSATMPIVQTQTELCIFGFGSPRVCRGDHALTAADWKYAKTRDMFFYLLCHPPRTKEQIGLVLWQDASDAQLRSNFRVALYHMRHALGNSEWILFENEQYAFNRTLPYSFDVDNFERAIAEARKQKTNDASSTIRDLQSAIDLYRGDFLEGSNMEWVESRQQELQREYIDALLMLGRLQFAQAQYAEATETYRKAIAADSFLEAAHRELMRCYARLGESGQALRQYHELTKLLRDEMGATPAKETQALYAQLQQNKPI